jgi:hypothetical protein
MSLHDKQGRELNDDGTRVGDTWFQQQRDRANFAAMSRKFEAESLERRQKTDEFWKNWKEDFSKKFQRS